MLANFDKAMTLGRKLIKKLAREKRIVQIYKSRPYMTLDLNQSQKLVHGRRIVSSQR